MSSLQGGNEPHELQDNDTLTTPDPPTSQDTEVPNIQTPPITHSPMSLDSATDETKKQQGNEPECTSKAGALNWQPTDVSSQPFQVGVSEDKNKRCRRTMEDAHSYVYDFGGVHGQGFFAIFDGHAGKHAAEWCGRHFYEVFDDLLKQNPTTPVPQVLNSTFHSVDAQLKEDEGKHSGCTVIVAFTRTEDREEDGKKEQARVLYTANVGDARAVLSRGGHAVRLSYDHKGSDAQEAKRITDAGGFVMNNRVNGVLAVTRSLGDSTMKDFVVGAPYTTETVLNADDKFLVLACDGLWDVCEDQDAISLVREQQDPQLASEELLSHALTNFSTDNLSVMVIRFRE